MTPFTFYDQGEGFADCVLTFDAAPKKALIDRVIEQVGLKAHDAMRVEVAFADLLAMSDVSEENWWTHQSFDLAEVPLGPSGASDIQSLKIGKGLAHHGLIVGRPGSGKTNLMHVIITGLALKYAPAEMELYLIDFKKGVGFKAYADHKLPHARVIAIESEREFGLSVLRKLDKELTRRGELFRAQNGAEKLSEYRERREKTKSADEEVMPRIILIADEFQEFFTVEDSISREATLLFDRIARQGRAFGIHMILGTQTLSGSYGIGRSTMDQMAIRVALQCSEADSRIILGDDNPGARFLSRPGEAIYNDENGQVQSNKLFQVAIFTEKDKEAFLSRIRERELARGKDGVIARKPLVFEGHLPANLEDSDEFAALVTAPKPNLRRGVAAWIGEPIAIKEPTHARLRRQAGANFLVVTRDEEQGMGVLCGALASLAVQHGDEECRFIIASYATADADWADCFAPFGEELPHETSLVTRRQLPDVTRQLAREVEARHAAGGVAKHNIFLTIAGIGRARELRKDEDDFSSDGPADELMKVLRDGPEVGVHCLMWADVPASLTRTLGRKALAEFGIRAAGVMSQEDSQTLIDDGAAAKIDRPHRMILFDEEQPGVLEKFRPFSLASEQWLAQLGRSLSV